MRNLLLMTAFALALFGCAAQTQTASNNAPVPTAEEAKARFAKEQELQQWVSQSGGKWEAMAPAGQAAFLEYHKQDNTKAHQHFDAIAGTTTFEGE